MLKREDNEIISRVAAGTPGGELMRQYWLPAAMSSELPGPDCTPLRVRLLGEDLIAFRNSQGQVGLVDAHCPHRGASLFFGRNEESGLRCVYHGWKFDVAGNCVDMPNEPAESDFKHKVKATAYPCVEKGRLIWTYMGPLNPPPPFPQLEFTSLPDDHVIVNKQYMECGWLQGLEGALDPVHTPFLHSAITPEGQRELAARIGVIEDYYLPREGWAFEALDLDIGCMVGARRPVNDRQHFWRVNIYLLPMFALAPTSTNSPDPSNTFVAYPPIDDEHHSFYSVRWHPIRPFTQAERDNRIVASPRNRVAAGDPRRPGSEFQTEWNASNDYGVNRELQRTKTFTGIPTIGAQDKAVQESMGPIFDRTRERLGTSDLGIIGARRSFLRAAKALRDNGTTPPGITRPELYMLRGASKLLDKTEPSWVNAMHDYYTARPGVNLPMP